MWPFSLLRRRKEAASPPPSTAQQIRDALRNYWLYNDESGIPPSDDTGTLLLPRGVYTDIAKKLGTDPTYVSIVAKADGYRIATKAERQGA